MGRRPRAAAQAAAASLRTPTPLMPEPSDDEMADAPPSNTSTPRDKGTPARNSEPPSEPATPAPVRLDQPRKRRAGRPPKIKPADWDAVDEGAAVENGSEAGTPFKKRRGRPSTGGGRWAKAKGGPSHVTQVPIDKEGNMMDVIDDEVAMPEDAEGETKVDKLGYLQGGRAYRCRTFTILGRKGRLYMLSTEPARCIGFRDSYLFFQKHKQLYKIIIDEPAKRDLIDRDLIPHSYKGRAIGVVTARSVFREFGARIVVGGRKVIDDYHAEAARRNGDVEGEIADPSDRLPKPGEKYNQNQYVAWHGASSVYHSGAPSVPAPSSRGPETKKRRVVVTDANWMLEHAREARYTFHLRVRGKIWLTYALCSRFNSAMTASRRQNLDGVYDPHTNVTQFPRITQPTRARWERVPPTTSSQPPGLLTNGTTLSDESPVSEDSGRQAATTIFPTLPPIYARNLLVVDLRLKGPDITGMGTPGPDGDRFDVGSAGLGGVDEELLAELPETCRAAFEEAKKREMEWRDGWRSETQDGSRGKLRIGF
ncbi:MAG: hypothetical protein M1832_003377 [Thelocarpon impressellum]|nr:MAG: hypothetical protein M1832_003377 [Thelocarpon impressellum]